MAAKKAKRKRRTREHVIADLSANHVERLALAHHFAVERITKDYGIDLLIFTYSPKGYIQNGHVELQLKATDSIQKRAKGKEIAFSVDLKDWDYWTEQPLPVFLVVYDAKNSKGYWVHIQGHAKAKKFRVKKGAKSATVRLPARNTVTKKALLRFADIKEKVIAAAKKAAHV